MIMLKSVFFIVETEHENDDHFCTSYNRTTLRRKIYTSRASAEQACEKLQSALPMNGRGFRQGEFGEIYHRVHEATIDSIVFLNKGTHYDSDDS